ncbi:MAG: MFS transporter [Lentisphaeria bacterium]|nr:MFS transporter [Lentisphaeria bacterium]
MRTLFTSLSPRKRYVVLLVIIYIGFISLGLPDTILGVAWDSMHTELRQPVYYAGFVTMLLTVCSAISAFCSGAILRLTGTGKLLMICAFVTGLSLLGYALSPAFWMLLLFAVPLGFGQGAVDTGMNFYVAKHYTSRDMNWLHCCWGIGATAGPLLATAIISAGWSWRGAYGTISAVQLTLAVLFLLTLPLWKEGTSDAQGNVETVSGKVTHSLRLFCCPLMMFFYCAAEVSMGLWAYQFLVSCRGVSGESAGYIVVGYWGMLSAGRFLIGFVANRLGNRKQIRYSMVLACIGGLLMLIPGCVPLTVFAIGLVGFAFASFYPAMMHAAPHRFNDATAAAVIGYQGGAALLGTAICPAAFGYLAARTSFGLLPCVVVLVTAIIFLLQLKVDGWNWKDASR